jgi:hypothetical protein
MSTSLRYVSQAFILPHPRFHSILTTGFPFNDQVGLAYSCPSVQFEFSPYRIQQLENHIMVIEAEGRYERAICSCTIPSI